jgi:hypothetical protein
VYVSCAIWWAIMFLHVENTPRNPNVANAKRGIKQKKLWT